MHATWARFAQPYLPREIASAWKFFNRRGVAVGIVLPVSLPILMVWLIWQFTRIGNDFLSGVIFVGADSRPITIALNNPVDTSERTKQYNVNMAAAIIAALRTLVFYIMTGRYFVRGLTAGAVKGDTLVFTQLNGNGSISRIHPDANPAPMSRMDLLFDVSKSLLFDHHVGGAHRLTRQTP